MNPNPSIRHGQSIVGLLVVAVVIVVLFAVFMTSLNKAVTGSGSQLPGSVRSFEDKIYLAALFQSMTVHAMENRESYLVPSELGGRADVSQNTTANLFSAMLMQKYTVPKQLISGNEYSGYVWEDDDYDWTLYEPSNRVYWDSNFKADLADLSNVSFAHVPLFGERFSRKWKSTLDSRFPLMGNRGPKDGVPNPQSLTYGRDGQWRGHIMFGDGHVDFVDTFSPAGLVLEIDGQQYSDNIFNIDADPGGSDAILSFTKSMTPEGPELQFD